MSPTSRFHGVPWGLLPALTERAFTTAPSAALWLRAMAIPESTGKATVLVIGPDLASGGAEVIGLKIADP